MKQQSLEDEIINKAGKQLADEIDFSILTEVLAPMTWEQGLEVDSWVETNIKGDFKTMGLVWVFEHLKDASWFTLRWASR